MTVQEKEVQPGLDRFKIPVTKVGVSLPESDDGLKDSGQPASASCGLCSLLLSFPLKKHNLVIKSKICSVVSNQATENMIYATVILQIRHCLPTMP